MSCSIPTVTDTEFARGLQSIPPSPYVDQVQSDRDRQWIEVAQHLAANGLGWYPEVFPREGVDLVKALRFLGAMIASPTVAQHIPALAGWLKVMFRTIRPEGGPVATEFCVSTLYVGERNHAIH